MKRYQTNRRLRLRTAATIVAGLAVALLVSGCLLPNLAPVASFRAGQITGVAPMNVTFDARASMDSDGNIVVYRWSFGDGSTAVGDQVAHIFAAPGSYVVTLTVVDDNGTEHSVSKTITALQASDPPPSSGGGGCGATASTGGGCGG
ncbi:MAG: PKD domain-containing protein [Candidatus Bipolaricaulota bacterium]|nr:MAG: PKD domain-containing protein [Candidatus Bipolaricaulota bacterium]